MDFQKINSYTWVLNDGKKSFQERQRLMDEQSISKSSNFLKEKKRRRPENQQKIYEKFCKDMFRERSFICQKEFNNQILMKFNGNTTWYRRRMIELGLITENNRIIKPVDNLKIND